MSLETKINDVEYAIDNLETTINTLKPYKQFEKDVKDLEIYKSALEYDLDQLKEQEEELVAEEIKQAQMEDIEQERQYWREAI